MYQTIFLHFSSSVRLLELARSLNSSRKSSSSVFTLVKCGALPEVGLGMPLIPLEADDITMGAVTDVSEGAVGAVECESAG